MELTGLSSTLRSKISNLHKLLRRNSPESNNYSLTELETIGNLYRNTSLTPTELAKLTHIKNQSMSQILAKLEAQEIIERIPSEEDRRKVNIRITKTGKKMVLHRKSIKDEWLKLQIEHKLNTREQKQLEDVIPILQKIVEINK